MDSQEAICYLKRTLAAISVANNSQSTLRWYVPIRSARKDTSRVLISLRDKDNVILTNTSVELIPDVWILPGVYFGGNV